jgi:hypothetical protein
MMGSARTPPSVLLTAHFFKGLFDFGVFTQEGADAFVRTIIGLIALILSSGFLLLRVYAHKYGELAAAASGGPYQQALLADLTLAIALPMWIVALVSVLISDAVFPGDTDCRVLMPLPIRRIQIFAAKVGALALFGSLFAITSHLALTPLVFLVSSSRWAGVPVWQSVLAFWISGMIGSAFAMLTVIALNGLVSTCLPGAYVHRAAVGLRTSMVGLLMLALPLLNALPTHGTALAAHAPVMLFAPPAWFMGLDRWLLGDRDTYLVTLATLAIVALVGTTTVSCAAYFVTYKQFDRMRLHVSVVSRQRLRRWMTDSPARAAVRDFTSATLRRSALHQGVWIGLSACAVAIAINTALDVDVVHWIRAGVIPPRTILGAIGGLPFTLVILLGIAVRATLVLPIEPRANWVFRLTDQDMTRADRLHAAEHLMVECAVLVPVVLVLPVHWMIAGPRALLAAAVTGACGFLWTEVLLHDWRRIPFTCAYMPGKHAVAQSFSVGAGAFVIIRTIGGAIEGATLRGPSYIPALITVATMSAIAIVLRRQRRQSWQAAPVLFDDELPSEVQQLGLLGE